MYSSEKLSELPRKELQALAKSLGLKANLSSETLIGQILEKSSQSVTISNTILEVVTEEITVAPLEFVSNTAEGISNHENISPDEDLKDVDTITKILEKGDTAFAEIGGAWVSVIIKRVNKKTYRVAKDDGVELTVNIEDILTTKPGTNDNVSANNSEVVIPAAEVIEELSEVTKVIEQEIVPDEASTTVRWA